MRYRPSSLIKTASVGAKLGDRARSACEWQFVLLLLLEKEAVVLILECKLVLFLLLLLLPQHLLLLDLLWVFRGHYGCEVKGAATLT